MITMLGNGFCGRYTHVKILVYKKIFVSKAILDEIEIYHKAILHEFDIYHKAIVDEFGYLSPKRYFLLRTVVLRFDHKHMRIA